MTSQIRGPYLIQPCPAATPSTEAHPAASFNLPWTPSTRGQLTPAESRMQRVRALAELLE